MNAPAAASADSHAETHRWQDARPVRPHCAAEPPRRSPEHPAPAKPRAVRAQNKLAGGLESPFSRSVNHHGAAGRFSTVSRRIVDTHAAHFEDDAPHGTSWDVFRKGPADAALVKVAGDVIVKTHDATGLAAGAHDFKVVGRNSKGDGPESVVSIINVTGATTEQRKARPT